MGDQVREKERRVEHRRLETEQLERSELAEVRAELEGARKERIARKHVSVREYQAALNTQLLNPPFRFPSAVPDSESAIFGRSDLTPERVADMRRRVKELMNHQLKATEAIKLKAASEKKESVKRECEMIARGKTE